MLSPKKRYRADVLIEDQIAKYDEKIEKEIAKARKRFGESFDEAQFRATNARVIEHQQKRDALHARYTAAMQGPDLAELKQIIVDEEIVDPISGTKNWTDVRQFNLMFSTEMGSVADGSNKVYLRPETAQGIFVQIVGCMKMAESMPTMLSCSSTMLFHQYCLMLFFSSTPFCP